jgi:hypothetical protein
VDGNAKIFIRKFTSRFLMMTNSFDWIGLDRELEGELSRAQDALSDVSGKLGSESQLRIAESKRADQLDENVQQLSSTRRELIAHQRQDHQSHLTHHRMDAHTNI